jgi:pimeloyl-ACP methyl ester carboxylesterase
MIRTLLLFALVLILAIGIVWFLLGRGGPGETQEAAGVDSPYWSEADRLVEVDGLSARVRVEGPEAAPVIVLVHGFSHSLEIWNDWAADLSADYRVVRMDLPGHGLTGPDPEARYSVPETVAFLGSLMDALNIRQAHIAGNSLGGLVAWRYAADNPGRVERLILLAPGGFSINGVTEDPVPVPMAVSFYLTQAPEAMIAAATRSLYGDPSGMDPDLPSRTHAMMRRDGVGQAMVQRLEVFTLPDPQTDLARIGTPTLILWGARDVMVPAEHGARFEAAIPDAELIVYDDLGHVVQDEAPDRTLEDVRAFLSAG